MDGKELNFKIMSGMTWMPLPLIADNLGISRKKVIRIFSKFSREVVISNDGDLVKFEDDTVYLNEKCVYMFLAWSKELHVDNIADIQSDFHEALEEHMEKAGQEKECRGKCKKGCKGSHKCQKDCPEIHSMKIAKIEGEEAEKLISCLKELFDMDSKK